MAHQRYLEYKPRTTYKDVLQPSDKVPKKIVSVWPGDVCIPHPTRHYNIPALEKGQRWASCEVGPSKEVDDLGEVRTLALLSISARRTALDVIGLSEPAKDELTGQVVAPATTTSEWYERGLFVPEGDEPTEAELVAAEKRRDKWLDAALMKGDRAWSSTHRYDMLPGDAILAAKFRNITDREWFGSTEARPESQKYPDGCPACGAELLRGKKVCSGPGGHLIGWDEEGLAYWRDDPDRAPKVKPKGAKAVLDGVEA